MAFNIYKSFAWLVSRVGVYAGVNKPNTRLT